MTKRDRDNTAKRSEGKLRLKLLLFDVAQGEDRCGRAAEVRSETGGQRAGACRTLLLTFVWEYIQKHDGTTVACSPVVADSSSTFVPMSPAPASITTTPAPSKAHASRSADSGPASRDIPRSAERTTTRGLHGRDSWRRHWSTVV